MTLSERERIKLLQKIEQLVRTKFYDPNFKGRDWHSIVESHRPKILSATEQDEFEAATNEMLRELGSSGLSLVSADTKVTPKNSISATFRTAETEYGSRWVFQDVHAGGPAAIAGISGGNVLIRIGDREVVPPEKPLFAMGRAYEVTIEKLGGPTKLVISIPRARHKENPCAAPEFLKADSIETIPIIKIPLFPGKLGIDFARELSDVFERHVNGADRVVLDLRGNPGGGAGCLRLMSLLTPGKQPVGFSVDRNTESRGYDKSRLPRFDRIPSSKVEVPWLALRLTGKKSVVLVTEGLGPRPFHGRVVVLVNEHTTCASEMVALFAREEAGAKIVGAATPGRLVTHTGFKIGHGFTLALPIASYVSWRGTRVDGKGINPDFPVEWSYSDVRNGCDNQLQHAVGVVASLG